MDAYEVLVQLSAETRPTLELTHCEGITELRINLPYTPELLNMKVSDLVRVPFQIGVTV